MMGFGITPLLRRRRTGAIWLSLFALLGHVLLPPAAAGFLNTDGSAVKLALCSTASESDAPGKAKPGLPTHHCALCSVSAATLVRPPAGLALAGELAQANYPRLGTEWATASLRRSRMQARAPPTMV